MVHSQVYSVKVWHSGNKKVQNTQGDSRLMVTAMYTLILTGKGKNKWCGGLILLQKSGP